MQLNSSFLWLSRCLFSSKNKVICQEHLEKILGVYLPDCPTFRACEKRHYPINSFFNLYNIKTPAYTISNQCLDHESSRSTSQQNYTHLFFPFSATPSLIIIISILDGIKAPFPILLSFQNLYWII